MHDWCSLCGVESWKHGNRNHEFVSKLTPLFKPTLESYIPKGEN